MPDDVLEPEREAFISLNPSGFFVRHPPAPHQLDAFLTSDGLLFQTIHMGAAEVNVEKWMLVVTGLVESPFTITLDQLRSMPSRTITAFHECYGSPLKPPTSNLWRIGNVTWTGVPLQALLARAKPTSQARFVWSEGLDRGTFANVETDRYQKDLPIGKAFADEVLVAYEMNSQPLSKKRGGPVRLVVPGWFGTNSTKWLSKLSVEDHRAPGPFTTVFYNEKDPLDSEHPTRPVWKAQTNSMIISPAPASVVVGPNVVVEGWAWSDDGISSVSVSVDGGETWVAANVEERVQHSWQRYKTRLDVSSGCYTLMARAQSFTGEFQPLYNARNHVHRVAIEVA